MVAPVGEETGGFRSDVPVSRIGDEPPFFDLKPQIIDERGKDVALILGGELFRIQVETGLFGAAFLGLGNGSDELGGAAGFFYGLSGLA